MQDHYKIADLVTKLDCTGRTAKQALPYRCAPSEAADITISPERIDNICKIWKLENPEISDEMLEYLATGTLFYIHLLEHDGLMLHSSAVVKDGQAYLFTADPGTGKSTHTSLWLQKFGNDAFILNDDKPALRFQNGTWYAYGTPWSGKYDISKNLSAPIAGIAILERGAHNEIVPVSGAEAIEAILRQVQLPKDAEHRILLMELLDKLLSNVPVWRLRCNMSPEAAEIAYRAMSERNTQERDHL